MRLYLTALMMCALLLSGADARRSSSSSFRSSSSSSRSSSYKSTPAKKVAPAKKVEPTKKATIDKNKSTRVDKAGSKITSSSSTSNKKAAVVKPKNKLDKKMAKKMASSDKAAFKKYSNKKQATADYRKKLAAEKPNKYTSNTPPATRPSHIPQSINAGGRNVNVTYHVLPGGGYGYGYMDPTTMMFMALTAQHYHIDPYEMRSAGYGHWGPNGQPIRTAPTNGFDVMILLIILGVIAVIIVVAVLANRSRN